MLGRSQRGKQSRKTGGRGSRWRIAGSGGGKGSRRGGNGRCASWSQSGDSEGAGGNGDAAGGGSGKRGDMRSAARAAAFDSDASEHVRPDEPWELVENLAAGVRTPSSAEDGGALWRTPARRGRRGRRGGRREAARRAAGERADIAREATAAQDRAPPGWSRELAAPPGPPELKNPREATAAARDRAPPGLGLPRSRAQAAPPGLELARVHRSGDGERVGGRWSNGRGGDTGEYKSPRGAVGRAGGGGDWLGESDDGRAWGARSTRVRRNTNGWDGGDRSAWSGGKSSGGKGMGNAHWRGLGGWGDWRDGCWSDAKEAALHEERGLLEAPADIEEAEAAQDCGAWAPPRAARAPAGIWPPPFWAFPGEWVAGDVSEGAPWSDGGQRGLEASSWHHTETAAGAWHAHIAWSAAFQTAVAALTCIGQGVANHRVPPGCFHAWAATRADAPSAKEVFFAQWTLSKAQEVAAKAEGLLADNPSLQDLNELFASVPAGVREHAGVETFYETLNQMTTAPKATDIKQPLTALKIAGEQAEAWFGAQESQAGGSAGAGGGAPAAQRLAPTARDVETMAEE